MSRESEFFRDAPSPPDAPPRKAMTTDKTPSMAIECPENCSTRQRAKKLDSELSATRAELERTKTWVCHHGGLLNSWANEWNPARMTLTKFIRTKLDAALENSK